jgi:hypothetical protein
VHTLLRHIRSPPSLCHSVNQSACRNSRCVICRPGRSNALAFPKGRAGPGTEIRVQTYQRHRFAAKYTAGDIALLAEVDRAHGRGPATRRILQRAQEQFGDQRYERQAKISVAHLYNLRTSARYRNQTDLDLERHGPDEWKNRILRIPPTAAVRRRARCWSGAPEFGSPKTRLSNFFSQDSLMSMVAYASMG